jgi:hypothetical protein
VSLGVGGSFASEFSHAFFFHFESKRCVRETGVVEKRAGDVEVVHNVGPDLVHVLPHGNEKKPAPVLPNQRKLHAQGLCAKMTDDFPKVNHDKKKLDKKKKKKKKKKKCKTQRWTCLASTLG